MTPKEITTLAGHRLVPPWVMKLALDVAAAEREACAKVCDVLVSYSERQRDDPTIGKYVEGFGDGSISCAAAIRARGEKNV